MALAAATYEDCKAATDADARGAIGVINKLLDANRIQYLPKGVKVHILDSQSYKPVLKVRVHDELTELYIPCKQIGCVENWKRGDSDN